MGESESRRAGASKRSSEQSFRESRFGTVVRALWPHKPALNLAQRMGISERGAQYIIDGDRRVTARALVVVMDEID
jgi:hypothetical protein